MIQIPSTYYHQYPKAGNGLTDPRGKNTGFSQDD
jgi:hypothetical protein